MSTAKPKVLAVIPARYAATRFPGKPLVLIEGKPMVQHVWERASQASLVDRVIVATDDQRIVDAVTAFGGEAMLTNPDHPSGTDRVWEVASHYPEYTLVCNVQGDEPGLVPSTLDKLVDTLLSDSSADIATPIAPITQLEEWLDPNVVKVVVNTQGHAIYFSRASIPYDRDTQNLDFTGRHRHAGVYLYRREALERFTQLPPTVLETQEKLEQLRALDAGMILAMTLIQKGTIGVDTPADLEQLSLSQ